eukprot:TRINITY_DN72915_c0_g1_i1.p1 TRINITY_DN72915_c0_g1~~TRINITY_DN72915_c0_g1_i1.p1  ORF type:complete len:285 (-),score=26.49 TRINITY_DN72915_c0_g1_i1:98-952(-)
MGACISGACSHASCWQEPGFPAPSTASTTSTATPATSASASASSVPSADASAVGGRTSARAATTGSSGVSQTSEIQSDRKRDERWKREERQNDWKERRPLVTNTSFGGGDVPASPTSAAATSTTRGAQRAAPPRHLEGKAIFDFSGEALSHGPAGGSLLDSSPMRTGFHASARPLSAGYIRPELARLQYREVTPEDYELLCLLDDVLPRRGTAPASVMAGLPARSPQDLKAVQCQVCLGDFSPSSKVVELPCQHVFHPDCVSKWLTQCKATCPVCAAPVDRLQY